MHTNAGKNANIYELNNQSGSFRDLNCCKKHAKSQAHALCIESVRDTNRANSMLAGCDLLTCALSKRLFTKSLPLEVRSLKKVSEHGDLSSARESNNRFTPQWCGNIRKKTPEALVSTNKMCPGRVSLTSPNLISSQKSLLRQPHAVPVQTSVASIHESRPAQDFWLQPDLALKSLGGGKLSRYSLSASNHSGRSWLLFWIPWPNMAKLRTTRGAGNQFQEKKTWYSVITQCKSMQIYHIWQTSWSWNAWYLGEALNKFFHPWTFRLVSSKRRKSWKYKQFPVPPWLW